MRPALSLDIDTQKIALLADAFGANIKQMRKAQIRALNKTMKWVRGKAVKAVAKELEIPQKIARQRVAAFRASARMPRGKVWSGLQPMKASRLGKVKQLKRGGVRAGRHVFDDAFAIQTRGGRYQVFRRTGEPKRETRRGRYAGTGIKREPVEFVELEWDTAQVLDILDDAYKQAPSRYFEILRQELKYEVFVKSAR
ncbi:phage tail protein [Thiohalophilus sp.]|uniref:phage tail protein n=1 Tax=Thiohalophilus sp. TaxID=3028392 RepID=UPI002ACD566F|nr:phage tail protein [Thiohalophilus sp.]MDZ7804334.1 phage tail protein [Thiohalophilus sp.]